jgi:uncharacterized protein (DUF885 family)
MSQHMSVFPSLSRRQALQGAMTAALAASVPRSAIAATGDQSGFDQLLSAFSNELLVLTPEQASQLGVDNGALSGLKSRLSDASEAGVAKWAAQAEGMRKRLAEVPRAALSGPSQTRYDAVLYATERGIDGARFRYGSGPAAGFNGGATPYTLSQQGGSVVSTPEFLNSVHQVHDSADAEAYLARVLAFAHVVDQESARCTADAAIGVMPPDFIAATTLEQLKGFRAVPAAQQPLVMSLASKAKAAGVPGDWAGRCTKIVQTELYPAVDRQIEAFARSTAHAPSTAGVQRLPDGDAFYAWALRMGTTTNDSPADIHRLGLDQNAAIKARLDTLLKAQGMSQGSVGERLQGLNKDKRFLFPNDDAGRAALIAYLNDCIARIRPLLPQISHLKLRADVMVKRVPVDIQDGAPRGYMNFASLDGSRPAIYYVNLKSTGLWPKFQLPTLTAHEGIPGHTWQGAYLAEHHAEIPQIMSLMGFNAFVEGWALYAEQLVDEHGLYDNDPFGRIGYLQAQQFRACRLVADTGLHAMGWSRAQTVQFLTTQTGNSAPAMTSETDRYCVMPGQACGYKMGHNEILRLRDHARSMLAAKFDEASFNDVIVQTGGVPLTVLATAIDAHIRAVQQG